jgi:hypothetical protein
MRLLKDRPPLWAGVLAALIGFGVAIFALTTLVTIASTAPASLADITTVHVLGFPVRAPGWVVDAIGIPVALLLGGYGVAAIVKNRRTR